MKNVMRVLIFLIILSGHSFGQTNCSYSQGEFNGCESLEQNATLSVFTEYVSSGANTSPIVLGPNLGLVELGGNDYKLCSQRLRSIRDNCATHNITNVTNGLAANASTSSDRTEDMVYHYLNLAWDFYLGSEWHEVGNLPTYIEFKSKAVFNSDEPAIQINTGSPAMLEYAYKNDNSFYPVGDDAYAILNGFFQFVHETTVLNRSTQEGIDYALGNYFAYRCLSGTDADDGNGFIFERGGNRDQGGNGNYYLPITMNLSDISLQGNSNLSQYYYSSTFKEDFDEQKQSELLSATLWALTTDDINGIGVDKVDNLIIHTLSQMYDDPLLSNNVVTQVDAVFRMYDFAASDALYDDDDMCIMIDMFSNVYGSDFYSELVKLDDQGSNLHYIPDTDGDLYIKDNDEDIGAESSGPGFEYNSVDIWNRHEDNNDDGVHEEPEFFGNNTNYLKVRINGNFCEMATANGNTLNDYELEIYRSKISICESNWPTWQSSFSNPNYLLGTYNFGTEELTLTDGSIINGSLDFFGNHAIITCRWIAPNSPNEPIKCSLIDISMSFMARLVDNSDAANAFDPITYETTGIPAAQYAYQNNNVAFKNTKVIYPHPQGPTATPTHGVVIPGGDPDDEIIFTVIPSIPTIHGSDEDLFDIGTPDFGEDYTDYGDLAIVLDDDTFADWIAGGAQGGGFTITQDQEIIITTPEGFFLGGIPASSGDDFRTAEIRYLAASNFKPVAFDIRLTEQVSGDAKDLVHVEVWHESQNTVPRSTAQYDNQNNDITLSPNPVTDGLVNITLAQDLEMKSIAIYDLQGKLQMQQSVEGNSVQVNIDALIKGLYILRLTDTEGKIHTKKGMKL